MTGAADQRPRRLNSGTLSEWVMRLPVDMRCEWMLTKYQHFESELKDVSDQSGVSTTSINAAADIRESQHEILEAAGSVRAHNLGDVRRKMALFCRHIIGTRDTQSLDAADKLALAILRDLEELAPQRG